MVRDEFRGLCRFLGELAKSPGHAVAVEAIRGYFESEGLQS